MQVAAFAMLFATAVQAQPAAPGRLPDGAFSWLAGLAGHCWRAAYPDGTSDTQCYGVQFDRFMRGTIEIVAPPAAGRQPYRGDSLLAWDAERSEIAFRYWGSAGNLGEVVGTLADGDIVFTPVSGPSGEAPATRNVWTRIDDDAYRVVRQRRSGDTWVDVLSVTYARLPQSGDSR